MLDFDEARARLLALTTSLETELVLLESALGRVLREDLIAEAPLPPFDYSAMDGYAVRAADVNQRQPWELPVAGECRAGDTPAPLTAGQALRIFTGARLPPGADSVVIQEDVTRDGEVVRGASATLPFANVRRAGEDLPAGATALAKGSRLGPFELGLIAALDRDRVSVARRPRVVIVPTGNELRLPGSAKHADSIPESNSPALAALCRAAGAEVRREPHIVDDVELSASAFRRLLPECDLLVTIGGVSVGDADLVRPALAAAGVELEFWRVAIKPGKPLAFGRSGQTLVLGLPGNPVSAQLTFALFGMPLLRALQGDSAPLPEPMRVRLAEPLQQKPGRLGVYRARLQGGYATVAANQASGSTLSLARANALIFVPKDSAGLPAGSEVDAIRLTEV
jgi:molybdopterin molybdotransferase